MAEIKLLCLKEYGNQFMVIQPGQLITLEAVKADWMMRDGPGCFEVVETKAVDAPSVDKMLRKGKTK
jgi:hypothetical protein